MISWEIVYGLAKRLMPGHDLTTYFFLHISKIILFTLCFLITGCESKYEDISNYPEYSDMIGQKYEIIEPLKIHGITRDKNYKKQIDFYDMTELPGYGGPEVIEKYVLKSGSLIQVTKVQHCVNCFFSEYTRFEVEIVSEDSNLKKPILIDSGSLLRDKNILNPAKFLKK